MSGGHELDAGRLAAELADARRRIAALEAATGAPSWAALVEHMLDGFLLLDARGVHLDVNPAFCRMTGFSREELVGAAPPHAYWAPEALADIRAAFARTLSGETGAYALTFVRRSGERFPVLVSPSVVTDAEGAMVAAFASVKDMTELRRAEGALAESEQLFRLTFDQAPIGAALAGLDYRFRRVNARFAQLTGYSAEELLERGFPDITHPDDVAHDVAQIERLAAGEIEEYARQKRYVRKDGSVAWGDIVVRPVTDDEGRSLAFLAMVADITGRRRAELALQETEDRFGLLFENTLEGVAYCRLLYDDAGRADDWVYLAVNPAYERLTGLTDVVGRRVTEVFPTIHDETPELFTTYSQVAETGDPVEFDIDFTPLAMWLHVSARRPEPGHFLVMLTDVTARKRAEQELRREKDRLARLIDSMADEVWFADAQGRFTLANPAALREFGADAADDTDVLELAAGLEVLRADGTPRPPEETPSLGALHGEVVRNLEEIIRTPASGELRHRLVSSTPVVDDAGDVVGSVSVVRDITDLRRAEQALQREHERAQQYLDIAGVMLVAIAADQTVLFANPRTCEVLGRPEGEIVGANWFDAAVPAAERETIRGGFAQLMADNVAPWEYVENRVVTGKGTSG